MIFFDRLNKTTVIIGGLFLVWSHAHAMIVSSSCLSRSIRTKQNKIVLLYDKHALSKQEIKQSHVENMGLFISILAKNKSTIPFLVEMSEVYKDPTRQKNMLLSPINLPIKLALDNDMRYKNINFITFDSRKHCDYFIKDMIMSTNQFAQAINQGYQFPDHFYAITTENFLNHLAVRQEATADLIKQLPVCQTIKDQDHTLGKKRLSDCNQTIHHLLKSYNIDTQQHIFNLIAPLNSSDKSNLLLTLLEENCFSVDINLFNNLLTLSQENPLCVAHAGAYHSHNIEKRLLSHMQGIEKDSSSSMVLPNLELENASSVKFPTEIPDKFMNHNMQKFITIDRHNDNNGCVTS